MKRPVLLQVRFASMLSRCARPIVVAAMVAAPCGAAGVPTPATALAAHPELRTERCGHATVNTAIGRLKLYFRTHRAPCGVAHRIVRAYFEHPPAECIGSGCFIHFPSGWNCHSAPAAVERRDGTVTDCSRDHGARRILTSRFRDRGFRRPARAFGAGRGARAARVYFPQAQDPESPAYRPRTLDVAGEGSFIVERMRWRNWGSRSAHGRGIGAQDDCRPDCADGTFHRAPAKVRLWRPRQRCGELLWTRMTFVWTHGPPHVPGEKLRRRVVWPLAQFPCTERAARV
jgi:hypothetical protein